MALKTQPTLFAAKALGIREAAISPDGTDRKVDGAEKRLDLRLKDWCGEDRDLDSVLWAAAQDPDVALELVAAIREKRAEYLHEMHEAHGCEFCSHSFNRPDGDGVLGWDCPYCG